MYIDKKKIMSYSFSKLLGSGLIVMRVRSIVRVLGEVGEDLGNVVERGQRTSQRNIGQALHDYAVQMSTVVANLLGKHRQDQRSNLLNKYRNTKMLVRHYMRRVVENKGRAHDSHI